MKRAILGGLVLLYVCSVVYLMAQPKPLKVEWVGAPVFARPYSGGDSGIYGKNPPPTILDDRTIEIGFREDGVVVWRKASKAAGAGSQR